MMCFPSKNMNQKIGKGGTGLYLLGRESKAFKFYKDYWNGLKRKWRHRKFQIGENGNVNLHDGITVIVNFARLGDTTISPSQDNSKEYGDIRETKKNREPEIDDKDIRRTAPQKKEMADLTKSLDVNSDIRMSPEEGETNSSFPDSLRLSLPGDFKTAELQDSKVVFDRLKAELEINSTEEPIKQRILESVTETTNQTTQSGLLEETDEQVMDNATNKIKFLPPPPNSPISYCFPQIPATQILLPFDTSRLPHVPIPVSPIKPLLTPTELEQLSSSARPDALSVPFISPPIVSSVVESEVSPVVLPVSSVTLPVTLPVISPSVTPVIIPVIPSVISPIVAPIIRSPPLKMAESLTEGIKKSKILSRVPPIPDPLGTSRVFGNILQAGAKTIPETKNSEFRFLVPTWPDELNPSRTVEKTMKVGAEILSDRDTPLFQSFPSPLEPTRALEKGVEAGVEIIVEATKDQSMFLNKSPITLAQLGEFEKVVLTNTMLRPSKSRQVPSNMPEKGVKSDIKKVNEMSDKQLSSFSLTSAHSLDIPKSAEKTTESEGIVLSQNTECKPAIATEKKLADKSAVSLLCPQVSPENNEPLSNIVSLKNSTEMGIDEACHACNEIDYDRTDAKILISNNYKREDKEIPSTNKKPIDTKEDNTMKGNKHYVTGLNDYSYNNTKYEGTSAHGQNINRPLEQIHYTDTKIIPSDSLDTSKVDAEPPVNPPEAETMTIDVIRRVPLLPNTVPPLAVPPVLPNLEEAEKNLADETTTTEETTGAVSAENQSMPLIEIPPTSLNPLDLDITIAESTKIPETGPKVLSSNGSLNPVEASLVITESAKAVKTDAKALLSTAPVTTSSGIPLPIEIPEFSLNPFEAGVLMTDPLKVLESDDRALSSTVSGIPPNVIAAPVGIPPVPLSPFEEGVATAEPAKTLKSVGGALSSTVPVIPPNVTASLVEIPPVSLTPLEGGVATAESADAIEAHAKALLPAASVIPSTEISSPIKIPQLSLNPFEAGLSMADSARGLESSGRALSSTVPVTPPNGIASLVGVPPVSINPFEEGVATADRRNNLDSSGEALSAESAKDVEVGAKAPLSIVPVIQSSEIPPLIEIPQSSSNSFETGTAMADLESGDTTLSFTVPIIPPSVAVSPVGVPPVPHNPLKEDVDITDSIKAVETGGNEVSVPVISSNGIPSQIEIPRLPLDPFVAGVVMAEPAKSLESGGRALSSTVPTIPSSGTVPPIGISPVPLEEGIGIVESAKTVETDAKALLFTVPVIPSSGTPPPIGIPQLPLNPFEAGVAIAHPAKVLQSGGRALSSIAPVKPLNGTASSVVKPPMSLTPLGGGVGGVEPANTVETDAEVLVLVIPSRGIPSPIEIPQLSLNTFEAGVAMAEPPKILESSGRALSSTVSVIPPTGKASPFGIPPVSRNSFEEGVAMADPARTLESVDGELSPTVPVIPPNAIASPAGVPPVSINPFEEGVATADPRNNLDSASGGEALSATVPVTPPNGMSPPVDIPSVSLNLRKGGVAIAEPAKSVETVVKELPTTVSLIPSGEISPPIESPQLSVNLFEVDVAMEDPAEALELNGKTRSSTVPISLPSGIATSPIEIHPVSLDPLETSVAAAESSKVIEISSKKSLEGSNVPVSPNYVKINSAVKADANPLKQIFLSMPPPVTQPSSVGVPSPLLHPGAEVTVSSSASALEASVSGKQENLRMVSELPVQISLTTDVIESPILSPASSEKYSQTILSNTSEPTSLEGGVNVTELKVPTGAEESSPSVVSPLPMSSEALNILESHSANSTVTSSSVAASTVLSEILAKVSEANTFETGTDGVSSKSSLVLSSTPNIPGLTTVKPLEGPSTPAGVPTLEQNMSDVGFKISEASVEAGPKLTRSTFSEEPQISEQPSEDVIAMESFDLASDWNRDMLGKTSIASAASSIDDKSFEGKHRKSLYKIFNILRDMSRANSKTAHESSTV